ncbi:MAG: response regulator [Oligoflexia bacterium]|nr:response regulator [Oligoflexia bacterium]
MAKKILITDDSETLRDQLREMLERAEGEYVVIEGYDGQNGLDVLKENPDTSLIILDYNMPRMNGLEMCAEVKKDERLKHIPIFMLTSEPDEELMRKGKSIGVIAWITKPFTESKLLAAIKKVLSISYV